MCRLFGPHAGAPVDAEFWLIDAPDSLPAQSAAATRPAADIGDPHSYLSNVVVYAVAAPGPAYVSWPAR